MTTLTDRLTVQAIAPAVLARLRTAGTDDHNNDLAPFAATGDGEPLRCCLRYATAGEQIMLISYAPFTDASVWREVGPVYVHAAACEGYAHPAELPAPLRTGPRLLRTYRADRTMNYAHNTLVDDATDLEAVIRRLLDEPDVAIVHVRTVLPQCFLYTVTA
jgi:hypothetical protein